MAAAKTERLMNLLIMLLVQRGYVTKDRIRDVLYPASSDEAFEKMFERDKEELRSLGVPIELGSIDPLFEDEQGYRISPEQFALPPISLTADEAAVIGLATRVWEHASMAEATSEAVRKLTAAGVEVDVSALEIASPRLSAEEGSFDTFLQATQDRSEVEFGYRTSRGADATTRHLQPWGVARYAGRWYAVGHDTDRAGTRIFRLSRVVGDARIVSEPGAFEVPEGTDVRAIARTLAPAPPTGRVTLLVRRGAGHALRRTAEEVEYAVAGPDGTTDWDRLVLTRLPYDLAGEVLAHGVDAYVEEPLELRRQVVDRLRAVVAR
ncbi:helix-turn-helix transcriptional regulator [Nocardioides sp. DS6]|uniref:Helix-turn-helix transcriptional regulator n=1 Tax=Nocardioides eburneus TaxID=3231482 RepID=A0ABV3SVV9_9ACTN